MKIKNKIFIGSFLIEMPLIFLLSTYMHSNDHGSFLLLGLEYFHIIPLSILSAIWLFLFGHGAPTIGSAAAGYIFILLVYLMQGLINAGVLLILNKMFGKKLDAVK